MNSFRGKNILITGAASGIGRLMSLHCAAEGANLAIVDVSRKSLEALAGELIQFSIIVKPFLCDISDRKAVVKASQAIKRDFGFIHILINNAGIVIGKPFLSMSLDEMERAMKVDYWGHLYFTKEFLPLMAEKDEGHIVNVASAAGLLGMPRLTEYCASKFADVGFSESLRRELYREGLRGIHVTCVCPYIIDTGMFKGFRPFLLNPYVKAEKVAVKILNSIKKKKYLVIMPYWSVKLMLILKLFPIGFCDWILRVFGLSRAMDTFEGRGTSHK